MASKLFFHSIVDNSFKCPKNWPCTLLTSAYACCMVIGDDLRLGRADLVSPAAKSEASFLTVGMTSRS
jgi:hypothetical protein